MAPPRTRLDPEGYYDRLGLGPAASHTDIVTAFRGKARLLHPDVPKTGNAAAFVALKQAYDVLSNRDRRAVYDRRARAAGMDDLADGQPVFTGRRPTYSVPDEDDPVIFTGWRPTSQMQEAPIRQPRFSDLPVGLFVGLAAFLCLAVYEAVTHLIAPPPMARDDITPNAATVAPLSASAHEAVLYGPPPVRLAGTPNFYIIPAATPAMLWRQDGDRDVLVPVGPLPPFSMVQAVRLIRQSGMLEVLMTDRSNGLVSADHVSPGDAGAARRAYCTYNAGPAPSDGELLQRHGSGDGSVEIENRAIEPAVIKLRDEKGAVALSVFLGPGGQAGFDRLPEGVYSAEFAIGELWSRACNTFAAGMRARRMAGLVTVSGTSRTVVTPDANDPATTDIPDQAFERN